MKSFQEALDLHLKAICGRDIEAYKAFLSDKTPVILIFASGAMLKGTKAVLDFHAEWFGDANWTWTPDVIDTLVMGDSAYALLRTTYSDIDEEGNPFTNESYVSLLFVLEGQEWILVRDQNTKIIPR